MDWLGSYWRLDLLIVAVLLAITGWSAWSDFRFGRIPNAALQRLLFASVLWMWVLAVAVGVLDYDPELIHVTVPRSLPGYFLAVLRNTSIALAIGVALWLGRLWAAGDAKLFTLVVLALPLRFYNESRVDLWPAYVLLYNYVLASFAVIFGDLLWRGGHAALAAWRRRAAGAERKGPLLPRLAGAVRKNAAVFGRFALMLVLVFMFVKVLRHFAREALGIFVELDQTVLYVVLFFTCHPIVHFMSRPWALIAAAAIDLAFLAVAAFTTWIPGLTVWTIMGMSVVALALIFFRMAYDAYQERIDFQEVEVDGLEPKMILGDEMMKAIRGDKAYFEAQSLELGPLLPDGLKPEQVPLVKRWLRERLPGKPVQIQKTFPMAPTILLGLLFTLLTQDYIFQLPR